MICYTCHGKRFVEFCGIPLTCPECGGSCQEGEGDVPPQYSNERQEVVRGEEEASGIEAGTVQPVC